MRQLRLCLPALLIVACGYTNTDNGTGGDSSGGSSSVSSSQGGSSAHSSGGASSSSPTGGSSSVGGTSKSSSAVGGSSPSSESSASKPTGGSSSIGGTASTSSSHGGASGGTSQTGGQSNGGSVKGGTTGGAGGTKPSGGTVAGGTTSNGGTASGGNTSGGSVANSCANLSFAPSGTGKTKPAGAAGGLKVLDWAGFKSAISYTFDDANSSQINNYAAMNSAGGHYTFYLISSKGEAGNTVYKTAVKDGHEMGNHTSDHSNCNSGSSIDAASTFIKSTFGVTAYAFAAPNGSSACNTASVSGKFLTDRSVNGGSMSAGDIGALSWLPSDIASSNNMAPTAGKWRTICIHGFTGGSDGAYQPISLDSFTSAVKSAVSGGSWVETVTNVAAYQVGQNVISKASGNNVTWTLPAVFPPNMCVRVTTSGGTVKQNGKEIAWDDHGYYEISLDAKSLTIE